MGDPVEQVGRLLFRLYRSSQELDLNQFPLHALKLLRQLVPFNFAWWGISSEIAENAPAVLHTSFTLDVPADYVSQWQRIMSAEPAKSVSRATPGTTLHLLTRDLRGAPDTQALLADFHIEQVLATTQVERELGLHTFLTLYRTQAFPRITETERLMNQVLMPHLIEARNINWITQLTRMRMPNMSPTAAAIADHAGVLYASDPRFHQLMCTEWPTWHGARLPRAVCASISAGHPYEGTFVVVRTFPVNGLSLLQLRLRSPVDRLSPRERLVAEEFAKGRSHKEIASQLNLAPVTVRHHLRNIYAKLQVADKAQLASMLGELREPQPDMR